MANSGGLMLLCRWASINDLVQNKFYLIQSTTEPAFTCSKSPTETPDESARSVEKLSLKTPEQSRSHHSGVLTGNSKHIPNLALVFLVFLLLTLNK